MVKFGLMENRFDQNPKEAIEQGISLVTEDRKDEGLVLILSCQDNIALPNMNKISRLGL